MLKTGSMVLTALVLAAVLAAGCSGPEVRKPTPKTVVEKYDKYTGKGWRKVAEARDAIITGDLKEARGHLTLALKKGPSAEAHYYLALIALEEDQGSGQGVALSETKQSLRDFPTAHALLLRGALLESDQPNEAIRSYEMGLKKADTNGPIAALLHRNLAMLLAREGQRDDAFGHLTIYVTSARKDGYSLSDSELALWGFLLYERGQEDEARVVWASISKPTLRADINKAATVRF